jgi:site-specific DNA-methyltransferase (adenine-specific)
MSIAAVLANDRRFHVEQGDALEVLRGMPSDSVDAIVCDPPAGISFMGKAWDSDKGGAMRWIRWLAKVMREARRVLKPGGHALVWALPRTSHWTGMALQLAGFEIRDRVSHLFGSGFPKSLDVSKGIDKLAGAEREIAGESRRHGSNATSYPKVPGAWTPEDYGATKPQVAKPPITAPATPSAEQWDGWGTALKPACEDWWLCRKPFRGSVVKTVLENGTGAINIDGCRVPHANAADLEAHAAGVAAIKERGGVMDNSWKNSSDLSGAADVTPLGRWPAHVLLSHAPGCERVGVRKVKASTPWGKNDRPPLFTAGEYVSPISYGDGDGFETVENWRCAEGCPVAELDGQSGELTSGAHRADGASRAMGYGGIANPKARPNIAADTGGASRYFTTFAPFLYTPKADKTEREKGCEYLPKKTGGELCAREDGTAGLDSPRAGAGRRGGRRNHHPTVKPTDLMRWLVRLITPPGGVVLDMFAGSGSTGVACSAEGFRFIGIELDPAYAEIARARILGDAPLLNVGAIG